MSAMLLRRPRVTDILAIAGALRRYSPVGGRRVVLAAAARLTVPALFAAALDQKTGER